MTAGPRDPAPAPPKGFRPKIPDRAILDVVLEAFGLTRADIELDHNPPLALRVWDAGAKDTIPPANDPAYLFLRIKAAHRDKTTGGTAKTSGRGSDVTEIARTKQAADRQREFRERLLAKERGEPKPGPRWGRRHRPLRPNGGR